MAFKSGNPAVDRYIAEGYETVRGMSSAFAATICGHIIRRQTELGITGHIAEIGTFEGRFFIAMALGLTPEERAIGIDRFDWPDDKIEARFLANCAAHGVTPDRFVSWKADSRGITPAMLRERLDGRAVRFAHIDSHHARECLENDLELVHAAMHPDGIICLDDMLHPAYPMLAAAAFDYLARHTEMRLLCVIDREDIVAAPKFLICREAVRPRYEHDLMEAFSRFHFPLNADMESYFALALTPWPRLAEV
jgi:predicted O-methyltransferase YrrM